MSLKKGLKFNRGIRGWEVLEDLDLGGVWLHAFSGEDCTIEGNMWLPDLSLGTVEDDAVLAGCLHKLKQV